MDVAALSITTIIVVITCLVSLAAFGERRLFEALLFEPFVIKARNDVYRFLTHALVHANWPHLAVNMFVLYGFGSLVEHHLLLLKQGPASTAFVMLYLGGVVFSSLPAYFKHTDNPMYRAVGASGGVSAVLFAWILLMPTNTLSLLFLPVPLPAWAFGGLYLLYSWSMDRRGGDNVAHDAHLHGALFGIVFMGIMEPSLVLDPGSYQRTVVP